MKEQKIIEADEIQNVRQVEQEKKLNFLGGFRLEKGHSVWELNTKTMIIQKAEIEQVPYEYKPKPQIPSGINPMQRLMLNAATPTSVGKVVEKDDCLYAGALNMKSALKKFGFNMKLLKSKKVKL